jgi:hypothetical protein
MLAHPGHGFDFQTAIHTTSRSRRVTRARFALNFPPSPIRGRRECRAPDAPAAACAMVVVERTRVSQVTPESPGIPRAMVLRLTSCSPRGPGFLATVACGLASANLTPASGCQDHTTSPSASASFVRTQFAHMTPQRPSHPAPYVRDDREAPLLWERDGGSCRDDLGRRKSGIFLQTGLDRLMGDLPVGQIGASPFPSKPCSDPVDLAIRLASTPQSLARYVRRQSCCLC